MMKAEYRKIEFFGDAAWMDELPQYTPRQENVGKNIELLDIVALTQDIPEYNLRRGEVGTVVEILSNGDAFEVEFSDENGLTYECRSFRAPFSTHGAASRTDADTRWGIAKRLDIACRT